MFIELTKIKLNHLIFNILAWNEIQIYAIYFFSYSVSELEKCDLLFKLCFLIFMIKEKLIQRTENVNAKNKSLIVYSNI